MIPVMNDESSRVAATNPSWIVVISLVAAAMVVRAGILIADSHRLQQDPDSYRRIAENLLSSGVYGQESADTEDGKPTRILPTAFRSPLYPLSLWLMASNGRINPFAIGLLHWTLGVATVTLVLWLANWWDLGRWGVLAGFLVACDPILLSQSTVVMTETLATMLATLGLICLTALQRRPTAGCAASCGGVLALAILCRPTFLPWLVLCIVGLLISDKRRRSWINLAVILLVAAAVLAPWTVRNHLRFGRPILTTTHGGYTLLWGNNPQFYSHLRRAGWSSVFDARQIKFPTMPDDGRQELKTSSQEVYKDQMAYSLAWQAIRNEPEMFVYACALRVAHLWRPLPLRTSPAETSTQRRLRYGVAFWYVVVYVLASCGLFSLRLKSFGGPLLGGWLLCLSFTIVHAFYWTDMRMRAPLMPFICLLAAAGALHLCNLIEGRKLLR